MCIAIAASQPQFLMSLRFSTLNPKKYLFLIPDKWTSLHLTKVPLYPERNPSLVSPTVNAVSSNFLIYISGPRLSFNIISVDVF